MFAFGNGWWEGSRLLRDDVPVVTISHHLAHAYGAFGTSPFDEAAILIVDGCGNAFTDCIDLEGAKIPEVPQGETAVLWHEKDSYYRAGGNRVNALFKDFSPWGLGLTGYPMHPPTTRHSIGGVYAAASKYIFRGLEDPGKLMGLAPYGRPGAFDHPIFALRDGRVFVRYDWMKHFDAPAHTYQAFKARFQYFADIAHGVQREVERALLYILKARHALFPATRLCYAGGVALNAVANRRLLKEGPFEQVHIQPAAADNGLAIGCAYYGWLEILKCEKVPHDGASTFGKSYSTPQAEAALSRYRNLVDYAHCTNPVEDAVSALTDGKVVGWFQGGSEFGPRALGNRSILADPRRADMRDHINARIKFREDFRPFAPAVLLEELSLYFDCDTPSPHMLLTAPIRPQWRQALPAVVHRDGSARIQTVTAQSNPLFHAFLRSFRDKTGISVLLNTSLNRRGMPIVETPEDAILLFIHSGLDMLFIGNHVVRKPPDFDARLSAFTAAVAERSARQTYQDVMRP
jgi:carbamoyltransferase